MLRRGIDDDQGDADERAGLKLVHLPYTSRSASDPVIAYNERLHRYDTYDTHDMIPLHTFVY